MGLLEKTEVEKALFLGDGKSRKERELEKARAQIMTALEELRLLCCKKEQKKPFYKGGCSAHYSVKD